MSVSAEHRTDPPMSPQPKLPKEKLQFGKSFTDHMLEVNWTSKDGWAAPSIHPLKPLEIHPASSSLHYGLQVSRVTRPGPGASGLVRLCALTSAHMRAQCFEGMKAYLGVDGHIRLFRPEMNMKRMNDSMTRLTMPVSVDRCGSGGTCAAACRRLRHGERDAAHLVNDNARRGVWSVW